MFSRLFETVFDVVPFGTYVVDVENDELVYMNQQLVDQFGDHRGEVCWKALYQLNRPCAGCQTPMLLTADGKPNGRTHVFEHFNEADERWYQMQEKAISWPDGRTVKYSIAVDISELKNTQNSLAEAHAQLALKSRELERLSTTDRLTGLSNRLKLDERLAEEIARARRYGGEFAVILIDLDHFKPVNDTFGHQVGDQVLVKIAELLRTHTRNSDTVGRWGGEEFLLICPETDRSSAQTLAENLRNRIREAEFPVVGRKTASLGVACWRRGDDEKGLIHRADEALYRAKDAGRDRVEMSDTL